MQAKLILMILLVTALVAAYANDEAIEINYGESISSSAVAGKTTRTGSEATITDSIRNFYVLAFTRGATYMGYDMRKQGNVWSYGDIKFWPETGMDFYSYSPMNMQNGSVSIEVEGDKKIANYSVPGDEDLLYALNQAKRKSEHKGERPVTVSFRHALPQIVFRIRNTSSNLIVFVDAVRVEGIEKQGTFS